MLQSEDLLLIYVFSVALRVLRASVVKINHGVTESMEMHRVLPRDLDMLFVDEIKIRNQL